MQSGNRFVNYIKNHKVVIIGLLLYIVAYILNNIFPPFVNYNRNNSYVLEFQKEMASGGFLELYIPNVLPGNRFLELFPLDILYFGVADMAAVVHYGIFIPAGLITYFSYLLYKILARYMNPASGKLEKVLTFHFFNNAMFYPLCFLLAFLEDNGYIIEDKLIEFAQLMNENMITKIIIGIIFTILIIAFIMFLFVPMVVNVMYFFGYLIAFDIFVDIIEAVDMSVVGKYLGENSGLHEFLSFLIAFIIIGIGNLLLEKILDVAQRISILPARKIATRIQKHYQQRRNKAAEKKR